MSEILDYIDDYFTGAMAPEERTVFEKRCETDKAFAQEVAFYINARSVIREELHTNKQQDFKHLAAPRPRMRALYRYIAAAAAILLLVIAGWWFTQRTNSPQQLASGYIQDHLLQISTTMSPGADSLQTGISAYNSGDYPLAEKIFQALLGNEQFKPDALKYLGIVYLVTKRYDLAIDRFTQLTALPLYANPGPFYKALALLKRGTPKDVQQAKELLLEVKNKQLPGYKYATDWLNKI
ncbi:MAG: hypothetical protein JO154_09715 [Chitinophaga sp.]|uniref:tetratricopeptide repeat protein n=1 Tax=Chitinophaga sp. TaxID=1869181 RepID=UPI0025C367C8|nr:hypothetical protein [Chitinophaga sp.]MBV8252868.1 hypothetical protein [Chitinophaga sp.]